MIWHGLVGGQGSRRHGNHFGIEVSTVNATLGAFCYGASGRPEATLKCHFVERRAPNPSASSMTARGRTGRVGNGTETVGFGESDESCALETCVSSAFGDDLG